MYSLIGECRFWTTSSEIKIKPTDLGSYRYHEKKEPLPDADNHKAYLEGKREYSELRGQKVVLDNKRPEKLKDSIRKLEDLIREHPVVYSQWKDNAVLRLMLSNGLLVHICMNVLTGSILRIAFDKYFVGKIISDTITDVLITKMHIVIAYNQNQITFVYLQKPSLKRSVPEKISRLEPKIFHIIIGGPSSTQGRRLCRRIACNSSFDLIAIWTKSSQNEVYPWRPTIRDQDRANVHVYKLSRAKLEPVCFHWTENDPICVDFVRAQQNHLKIVEQRVTRKGEVFIEDQVYEIVAKGRLQRTGITSIPLQSQVCCQSYSPDQEKLMLGCIDGSVCLFDAQRAVTHMVRAGFIPTVLSWHSDSAVILVGNERGQIQFFDISLACLKSQLASEDMVPSNLIDLSPYFTHQPTLKTAMFNRKPELHLNTEKYAQTDSFVFLSFEGGPVASLRVFGGCGLKGDIHTSGFTVDVLVHKYLSGNQVERAINLLLCLNWDVYGAMCLISLHKIVNYIFRLPLTGEREAQLQKALGSFHAPVKALTEDTEVEFGEQVNDIMRKFFHYLLRYRAYEKAFALGIDINDDDLFVDLYNAAKLERNEEMANDALRKAQEILRHADENLSVCSHSSCSYCGSVESITGSSAGEEERDENAEESPNKRPDIVECSSSSNELESPGNPSKTAIHPPLPQIRKTTYREPCYIPPLPLPSSSTVSSSAGLRTTPHQKRTSFQGSSHQRMFIPKPQLTVSHHKSTKHRNSQQQQQFFEPPPLPIVCYDRSLNEVDLDDFVYDYVPKTASKRALNHMQLDDVERHQQQSNLNGRQGASGGVQYSPLGSSSRRNSNFTYQKQKPGEHCVIDVFPKKGEYIDQTLGIPVATAYDVPGVMKTNLPRQPMNSSLVPFHPISHQQSYSNNKTERTPQVVHQYPLISGQIPPANGGGVALEHQPKFNMIMSRPFGEGPPVIQPSAMAAGSSSSSGLGGGAGNNSSSNSSKSSGEKNKVKFSDTITVAVVPEIPRKEKGHRGGMPPSGMKRTMYTDPRRELADSLPLCHPNEDYLKNFQPAADVPEGDDPDERRRTPGTIKVIHFGVV